MRDRNGDNKCIWCGDPLWRHSTAEFCPGTDCVQEMLSDAIRRNDPREMQKLEKLLHTRVAKARRIERAQMRAAELNGAAK